jgi:hypothetical protein
MQKTVHIKVNGMKYPHAEINFKKDTQNESDLDIYLSDRYAIRLGLQWLAWQDRNQPTENPWADDLEPTPLIPWLTCRYRF